MNNALNDELDDSDLEDDEWADDSDEEEPLLYCPSCRETVHEDTQKCPHCGDWITPQHHARTGHRILWVLAVILLILSMTVVALF